MDDKELVEVWRKEFESQFGDELFARGTSGAYINNHRNSMWQGFCMAKRSQPSVVLPSSKSFPSIGHPMDKLGVHGYELALSDVKSSLTTAGIKYTVSKD